MTPSQTTGQHFLKATREKFDACKEKIDHCLGQLDDEQFWWRPHESMNSIANVILHLCGNLRQWIISGVGGAPDQRNRPKEFSERSFIPKSELTAQLDSVLGEVDSILMGLPDERLLEPRTIQGYAVTVLSAILEVVSHFNGHTQEIIYVTRLQLGDAYRFAWVPTTPEEISANEVT